VGAARRRYRRRPGQNVVAVQLKLDTDGFVYRKWGAEQRCKPGDWLVDDNGDIHTVDADAFARTYRPAGNGTYFKATPVWAEVAARDGFVETKEGRSRYAAGDYLVYNEEGGGDAYCMSAAKFEAMYEPDTADA
jgi:hypothetical protein